MTNKITEMKTLAATEVTLVTKLFLEFKLNFYKKN